MRSLQVQARSLGRLLTSHQLVRVKRIKFWLKVSVCLEGVYLGVLSAVGFCPVSAGPLVMELIRAEPHGWL